MPKRVSPACPRGSNSHAFSIQVNNTSCLGYEDIFGNKYDMMDGVDIPNTTGNQGKWRIWMPDSSIRWIQGMKSNDWWVVSISHGKYMDVVLVGTVNGSSSTYYCDKYWYSGSTGRVIYRGYNNANANGGVSHANASNDASNAVTNVGPRLANKNNRRTTNRTCPGRGAEGGAPQQKYPTGRKLKNHESGRVW